MVAKAPLVGFAKTRLVGAAGFGAADVARLAEAFLRDTLRAAAGVPGAVLMVSFAPPESEPYFRELAPPAHLVPQAVGDLGARLELACAQAFALGAGEVVVIGSDTPHIGAERIARAFAALEACDCVLGPAADGGYYLIGLRRSEPRLFRGIPWSSARVLAETLERARRAELAVALLDELFDVDDAPALERLSRALHAGEVGCEHTARVLAELARGYPRDGAPGPTRGATPGPSRRAGG